MSIENLGFTSPTISQLGGKTAATTTMRLKGRAIQVAVDFDEVVGKDLAINILSRIAALVDESGIGSATTVSFHVSRDGKIVNEQSIIKILDSEIESKMESLYKAAIDLDSDFTTISAAIKPEIKRLEEWKDSVHTIVDKFNKTIKQNAATEAKKSASGIDEKIFTSPKASEIKHALTEVYTAEAVFLKKLEELREEPSLNKADREKLEELITNTKAILTSLTAFDQLGVKQESRLRTLRQDFGTKLALETQKSGPDKKTFSEIAILQEASNELSRTLQKAKEGEKAQLTAELNTNKRKIEEAYKKLAKSPSEESRQLAAMYREINSLTEEKGTLTQIPLGLFDNLRTAFSKQAMQKQYGLLKHFKAKAEGLMRRKKPAFTKYQELTNKITRYPMVINAVLEKIPEELQPTTLKTLSAELSQQVIKINAEEQKGFAKNWLLRYKK